MTQEEMDEQYGMMVRFVREELQMISTMTPVEANSYMHDLAQDVVDIDAGTIVFTEVTTVERVNP